MNSILDFFKKLFCTEKSAYTPIPEAKKTSSLEKINSAIGEEILKRISNMQEKSYQLDKSRSDECIVCLEENVAMVPLTCIHSICYGCYARLINNDYANCPICNVKMEICNKLYAIITSCGLEIGIVYLPPIYCDKKNIWLDHEIIDPYETERLVDICQTIYSENYVLLIADPSLAKVIAEIRYHKLPGLLIMVLNSHEK